MAKCSQCEFYRDDICIKADHIGEVDDPTCLARLNHILLRDILFELQDEADEGEGWKWGEK
jgi:hypothetical protein